jgi:nitrogen regulatory protein P-II 1
MKLIVGIIQPDKLDEVLDVLEKEQIHLVTVTPVLGRGRQKGVSEIYRSHKEAGSLLKKVRLDIAVTDAFAQRAVDAIVKGAHTGNIGDGKVFVLDLKECVRISSGEKGDVAIG